MLWFVMNFVFILLLIMDCFINIRPLIFQYHKDPPCYWHITLQQLVFRNPPASSLLLLFQVYLSILDLKAICLKFFQAIFINFVWAELVDKKYLYFILGTEIKCINRISFTRVKSNFKEFSDFPQTGKQNTKIYSSIVVSTFLLPINVVQCICLSGIMFDSRLVCTIRLLFLVDNASFQMNWVPLNQRTVRKLLD